jgi:hypothetical protein
LQKVLKRSAKPIFLTRNYRSTKQIAKFVENYGELDKKFQQARVRDKPRIASWRLTDNKMPVLAFLLPLINRVEVRLSGARTIALTRVTKSWVERRNVDRYEFVGVVDVVSNVELERVQAPNPLVEAVRKVVPTLPAKFEIIVDYKGMRRPSTIRKDGRLDLASYEWQLQNYAYLRERQGEGPPVAAGVLLFLNELHPTLSDVSEGRRETQKNLTDIPHNLAWKSPEQIPDTEKIVRTIHAPNNRQNALRCRSYMAIKSSAS